MPDNLPTVTVEQFTTIVERQFKEGNTRPIFGLGKGGIGKTQSIRELADRLDIGYIDIRLLMYNEVDLKGIPYPNNNNTATIWLQNDILPKEERDGKEGILVFDEITSVARSVRTAAYQILNERRLGEYVLPKGWMIVCLGNGPDDGGDYQGIEGNFGNRCSMFNVTPSIESFKAWAYKANINYLVLGYVSWRPSDLHTYNPDSDTELLFASPRSWEAVSNILNIYGYNKDDEINNLRIISNVGSRVGNQFIAFCKYKDSTVDLEDIVEGKQVKEITEQEVLYMTIQGVVKLMYDCIKSDKEKEVYFSDDTLKKCSNGLKWMMQLKTLEHSVMAIKDFVSTDMETVAKLLLNKKFNELCPELMKFAQENKSIFRRG